MYLYSAYAPQLASELSFNATNSSLIGIVGNLGMAFTGPVAGYLVDRRGFTIPLTIGAISIFCGYFIIRNAYSSQLSSVPIIAFALLMVGSGSTFCFSALVKCAALNFPNVRGMATSVPMAAYGLSAFFLSGVASMVTPGDTYGLLCLLSFLPASLFILTWPFIRFIPLHYISVNEGGKGAELKRTSKGGGGFSNNSYGEKSEYIGTNVVKNTNNDIHSLYSRPIVNSDTFQIDIHGTRLLRSRNFWLHFMLMGILGGVGQMYIYSCGYCVRALTANPESNLETLQKFQSIQVAVISLTSFTGRILSGSLSDYVHNKYKLPRTVLLFGSGFMSLVAQGLALSVTSASQLWIVSAATGLAYGICFGSYPTIVSDTFGMRSFSQNWGLLSLSPVPVSYMFNMMFGAIYDTNSRFDESTGHRTCSLGKDCYSRTFLVSTIAAGIATLVLVPIMVFKRR